MTHLPYIAASYGLFAIMALVFSIGAAPVSYTHLTLPTN